MKKILTLLLAVAMIFSFVACDQPTGNKDPVNNSGSGNNQTTTNPENVDPSTLTEEIESADEIDWNGTWDYIERVTNIVTEDGLSFSHTGTNKGYSIIDNNKIDNNQVYDERTFRSEFMKCFDDYTYNHYKADFEGYTGLNVKLNDEAKEIFVIPGGNPSRSWEVSLEKFYSGWDGYSIKTNSDKTVIELSYSSEFYSRSRIYCKR